MNDGHNTGARSLTVITSLVPVVKLRLLQGQLALPGALSLGWEVVQSVGHQTLDLIILVRVQASQPIFSVNFSSAVRSQSGSGSAPRRPAGTRGSESSQAHLFCLRRG